MLARVKIFDDRLRRHNTGQIESNQTWRSLDPDSQRTFRNPCVKRSQRERYYKTGRGRDELNSIRCRAVAAATGRRFKSCRPDFSDHRSALVLQAATTIRVARASRVLVFASRENELYK